MPIVQAGDDVIEFPDSMSSEDIKSALNKHYTSQALDYATTAPVNDLNSLTRTLELGAEGSDMGRRQDEKAKLAGEMSHLRNQRILGDAAQSLLGGVEQGAGFVKEMEPLNLLKRTMEIPAQLSGTDYKIQPLLSPENAHSAIDYLDPTVDQAGSFKEGVKQFGAELASGLTSPDQIAALVAGKANPELVGRLFQTQVASQIPGAAQQLQEAIKSGDSAAIGKASASLAATVAIPTAIEKGARAKPNVAPEFPTVEDPAEIARRATLPPTEPFEKPTIPVEQPAEVKPAQALPQPAEIPKEVNAEDAALLNAQSKLKEALPEQTDEAGKLERVKLEKSLSKPIMAVRLKDGTVVSDPGAYAHYHLVFRKDIDPDLIESLGFVEDGKYRTSAQESVEAPPSADTGEAKPSAAPVSGAMEPPVAAEGTPQAIAEPATPKAVVQPGESRPIVTDGVTEPSGPQMGAAGIEELPETGTGLKNALGDKEREALGLHDAPETVVRNMEKAWDVSGEVEAAKPGAGKALADALIANPEIGLTDADSALLLRHKTDLFNKLNDAAERTHVGDDLARQSAQAEHEKLLIDYGQLLDAVKRRGAEWGREGRWRQAMSQEDFSFTSTDELNRYHKTLTGGDLPGTKIKRAEKIASDVKEAQSAAEKATNAVQDDLKKKTGLPKSPTMSEAEKRAFDAANKTVREAAVAVADKETIKRVEAAKTLQEVRDIQADAAKRAVAAANDTVRKAAKGLTDAETAERVAKSKSERDAARVQQKAAQKAIDLADKVHRDAVIALAKAQRELRDDPIKAVWTKVKEQIDKGEGNFDDIRSKVAIDLGMKVNQVTRIMAQDKNTKLLMNDAWAKQQKVGRLRQEAKRWVAGADTPEGVKLLTGVPRILFGLKTFGHGTVPLGTHAPFVAFQPVYWGKYFSAYKTMYKMVLNKAFYQQQVSDLVRRPNFVEARRAGLVNDPATYEDYTNPEVTKFITGGQIGNRGFTVLKILRQDMFDQRWDKLPRSLQVPEVAKAISEAVNHDTGVIKAMAPKGYALALFAPRLEASRVMSLLGDPGKAGTIFAKQLWTRATPAEREFAIHQVQSKAMIAGTLFAALAANQGILSAIGSKQNVNFDDPMKSDFLKFKVAGMDFAYGNAMLSMIRMPASLYRVVSSDGGKTKNLVYADESVYTVLGRYTRSQLSPFMGTLVDQGLGADFESRPLPRAGFGLVQQKRPVPKRLAAEGAKPYSYPEYWSEQMSPIPGQEAIREVWKHGLGMSPTQIEGLEKAVAITTIMAATGGRLTADHKLERKR